MGKTHPHGKRKLAAWGQTHPHGKRKLAAWRKIVFPYVGVHPLSLVEYSPLIENNNTYYYLPLTR